MKTCRVCCESKPISDFGASKASKDGLMGLCKKCNCAKTKAYAEANKEKVRAYHANRRIVKREELKESARQRRQENLDVVRQSDRERYIRDRDAIRARQKDYYYRNQEKALESSKAWRASNPERAKLQMVEYYSANRDAIRLAHKEYYQNNKDKFLGYSRKRRALKSPEFLLERARNTARRRAKIRMAIPSWFCEIECSAIYEMAQEMTLSTGVKHEVDHIVPIRSPKVCGLHWHGNMRVITKAENATKGNRYWPDMPNYEVEQDAQ